MRDRNVRSWAMVLGVLLAAGWTAGSAAAQGKDSVVVTGEAAKRSLTKGEISGETAEKISQACQEFAKQHNFAAIIFILDPYGNIVHSHRMDGVRPVQFESAINKAKTSLFMRTSTSVLAERVGKNEAAQVRYRMQGLDWGAGGVPIIVDDQLIGAIGVAGSDPMDEPCAAAGLSAVGIAMPPVGPPVAAPAPPQPQR